MLLGDSQVQNFLSRQVEGEELSTKKQPHSVGSERERSKRTEFHFLLGGSRHLSQVRLWQDEREPEWMRI